MHEKSEERETQKRDDGYIRKQTRAREVRQSQVSIREYILGDVDFEDNRIGFVKVDDAGIIRGKLKSSVLRGSK